MFLTFKMKNEKAQSDVVSTVLIILIVVVAIAIIGVIILRVVNNSSNRVENNVLCQSLNIAPVQCVYNNTDTYALFSTKLPNNSTLANLTLIFDKENGDSGSSW